MRYGTIPLLAALTGLAVLPERVEALEIELGGRVHADYAAHDSDVEPLRNDLLLRRAKVGLKGKFNKDWSFETAYDFAGQGSVDDLYVQYDGFDAGTVTIGQFKVRFGLDTLISSNDSPFIERALPIDAFAQSRRKGAGFNRERGNLTFAAMAFGPSIDGDEGNGAGARLTYAPVNRGRDVVHLGVAATSERPGNEVNFRARPESRPTDFRLVRTGDVDDVRRVNQLGLEAAWRSGPFSVQTEWMRADVRRSDGETDLGLDGWYVGASWVLTGQSREYKGGRFRGVETDGTGAWELTARYSTLDLDDADAEGGEQTNMLLGLNWYATRNVRIMANYIKVNSDRRGVADDPSILLVRAQVAF